ncbi:integrase catalytic domain-containing protein [Trichonephila clavipes]|nr:integrase catalytic domain-containing protein [Trichonephila clavipes]
MNLQQHYLKGTGRFLRPISGITGELRCSLGLLGEEVWPLGGGTNGVKEHFSGCGGGFLLVYEVRTLEMKSFESSGRRYGHSVELELRHKTLKRFWEIEVETTEVYSDELKYCNDHFEKTHLRKPYGKFVVEMPFKPDSSEGILGNSKAIASKRLDQLRTRLERDPAMQTLYSEFLNEYELLQHMEQVKEDSDVENGYYLPHHGVLRSSSKTTRLRVVFNASAKTSSGLSLNDLLCKGGVIQEDLFSILIRLRKYAYAFTADIRQMFRMIENPSQTKLKKSYGRTVKPHQLKFMN